MRFQTLRKNPSRFCQNLFGKYFWTLSVSSNTCTKYKQPILARLSEVVQGRPGQRHPQPRAYDWFTIHTSSRESGTPLALKTWTSTAGSAPAPAVSSAGPAPSGEITGGLDRYPPPPPLLNNPGPNRPGGRAAGGGGHARPLGGKTGEKSTPWGNQASNPAIGLTETPKTNTHTHKKRTGTALRVGVFSLISRLKRFQRVSWVRARGPMLSQGWCLDKGQVGHRAYFGSSCGDVPHRACYWISLDTVPKNSSFRFWEPPKIII